jgi:hypothetical protein
MKKLISVIVASLIILLLLLSIPSKVLNETKVFDSKIEYAAIPPVEAPTKPPRK